jgi:hypothetical protein
MSRPRTQGPRSLMRIVTPLWQTRSWVPNGSLRWAAVIAAQFSRSPLAVLGRTDRHVRHKCSLLPHLRSRPKIAAQPQPYGYSKPAPSIWSPPDNYPVESIPESLNQKSLWHKLDQQGSEIRQANNRIDILLFFQVWCR